MSTDDAEVTRRLRAAGCVFAEEEAALLLESAERDGVDPEGLIVRRIHGEPLEHIVGWAEFHGLRVAVGPGVFVPRRRTGFLVDLALDHLRTSQVTRPVVLDLCCGSGALGLALGVAAADAGVSIELSASDIEPAAVVLARRNLTALGATVHEGDLFEPVPAKLRARIDILLCNTPYVPTDRIAHMPPEARDHEPRRALDGGPDGLDILRRVAAEAGNWLAPGGALLVEESRSQAAAAADILRTNGLRARITESEDYDATAVLGIRV
ncbi:putative protein N(5)-glutamine methyltransferase [Nocardia bovistercoris]|uniref:peptide chain release factor N(5)-glutamine methyltransferase n=1 Tax=Nocardia bovistercoris TaxID=2785916 RepID=A0A931I6M7_9NOCA|nr:putative protein N(5)-glutamine methyltransferase [Nocardia bovistercoris]MBH0774767.1 putative protein N(5)-glutamine methyltransferase [Nocardia bovistercoris]